MFAPSNVGATMSPGRRDSEERQHGPASDDAVLYRAISGAEGRRVISTVRGRRFMSRYL